ncbi:alcohol dehydrogenase, partial [Amphidinium carterae]
SFKPLLQRRNFLQTMGRRIACIFGCVLYATANECHGLPSSMAAVLASSAAEMEFKEVAVPSLGDLRKRFVELPSSCEVLVNVAASSVNPADLAIPGPFPQVIGSDLAGTVVAVEPSCQRLKEGDRVWADIGAITKMANSNARSKENGAYGQVAVALESQLGIMPGNLDFKEAGTLPKVALTAYKALAWYGGAPYTTGRSSVLILGGSGGTGTVGIQLAKAFGASHVVTTTSMANIDYVKSLGADEVIDYHAVDWSVAIADGSMDAILDFVGVSGTGDKAMAKLKDGGFYVSIVGQLPSVCRTDVNCTSFINSDTNLDNVDLLEALRKLAESDQLRMRRVASYSLASFQEAFSQSRDGHVVGKLGIDLPPLPQSGGEIYS